EVRIIAEPAPDRGPAQFPLVTGPCRYTQILTLEVIIEGLEAIRNADILIRTSVVIAPDAITGIQIIGGNIAADTKFTTRYTDDDIIMYHCRVIGHGLTLGWIGILGMPELAPRISIQSVDQA